VFARADFSTPAGLVEARAPFAFWILLLAIWAALNAVFLAVDLFTLYVALELLTFAAVAAGLTGWRAETLQARCAICCSRSSVRSCISSARRCSTAAMPPRHRPALPAGSRRAAVFAAAALMTVGLLAKTALFPLHLWLPPAHAGAPAAASAVLSGLVVKGSFFIVVRLGSR